MQSAPVLVLYLSESGLSEDKIFDTAHAQLLELTNGATAGLQPDDVIKQLNHIFHPHFTGEQLL